MVNGHLLRSAFATRLACEVANSDDRLETGPPVQFHAYREEKKEKKVLAIQEIVQCWN